MCQCTAGLLKLPELMTTCDLNLIQSRERFKENCTLYDLKYSLQTVQLTGERAKITQTFTDFILCLIWVPNFLSQKQRIKSYKLI